MAEAGAPPRLLLIEDDAAIARFVEMALEDLALPVVQADCLAEARKRLAAERFDLVLTDLMLPDGSAEALLDEGRARHQAWIVFSAGLTPEREARLRQTGVKAVLSKPASLAALLQAVSRCLDGVAPGGWTPLGPAPEADPSTLAVQQHFGGDRQLFEAFRTGCLARFATDLRDGDAALAGRDAQALRRLAHSLKSVLTLLGHPVEARQAAALEHACTSTVPDWPALGADWALLAAGLAAIR